MSEPDLNNLAEFIGRATSDEVPAPQADEKTSEPAAEDAPLVSDFADAWRDEFGDYQ